MHQILIPAELSFDCARLKIYMYIKLMYRTFKQDCPVHITLRADENGNMLKVRSVNFEHNHEVSQVFIGGSNVCVLKYIGGYCNYVCAGTVQASSSAKAPYKRSEGKGSHSLKNESQQKKWCSN